ncbi:IS3 family transposase, partial [Mesorhizobium sp. M0400]
REHNARPRDAMDKETCVPRSRGRSLVVLFNTARPHSSLGYQTPAAFAGILTATGSVAAQIKGYASPPVAQPAPYGVTETVETLIAAG